MKIMYKNSMVFRQMTLALVLPLFWCVAAEAQCSPEQTHKLLPDDGAAEDHFGDSVGISGNLAIVGMFRDDDNGVASGSAYLFDTITGEQIAKLLPNDGEAGDRFGRKVAIDGNLAIVGSPFDGDNGYQSGSAYLFDTITGQQIAKLLPNDGEANDRFGSGVAIDGNIAIVGAPSHSGVDNGSAYLFDTTTGQQIDKLLPNDSDTEDYFGHSVAISGTTAVIGAYGDEDNGFVSGSAYLFDTTTGQQFAKLLPQDGGSPYDYFGLNVAINGTVAIVSADHDDDNGPDSGSAYLFDITTGQQLAKLLPDDGAGGDDFGASVAISGTIAIVGARYDDDNGYYSGSAYLFDTATGQQIAKIWPNDGTSRHVFGGSVSIDGNIVVASAAGDDDNSEDSGSAYLFDISAFTCPIEFEYPNGPAIVVSPEGGTTIRVMAINGGGEPQSGTGVLHVDRGFGFEAFPMTEISDNVYDAEFPSSSCGTYLSYYVAAESASGEQFTDPLDAPISSYSVLSAMDQGVAFADDFETDLGWTVTGDATDGQWDRGVPAGDGARGDPLIDGDGSGSCYVTDNVKGNSDVDDGSTVLTSPIFDVTGSGAGDAVIAYYRWYSNGGDEQDIFVVEISNDGGSSWTNLETVGPEGPEVYGGWFFKTFRIGDVIQPTDQMRVRFIASDTDPQSVVEAGVDGVEVRLINCDDDFVVSADQFNVFRGIHIGGDLSDVQDSDDSYLKFNAGLTLNPTEPPVWIEFEGTLPTDSPTSLSVTLEASVSTPNLGQTIEAFNWITSQYEQVDSQSASFNNDSVVTVDLTADIGNYVESGTGAVKIQTKWQFTGGLILGFPWTVCIDQVVWTVTE